MDTVFFFIQTHSFVKYNVPSYNYIIAYFGLLVSPQKRAFTIQQSDIFLDQLFSGLLKLSWEYLFDDYPSNTYLEKGHKK